LTQIVEHGRCIFDTLWSKSIHYQAGKSELVN